MFALSVRQPWASFIVSGFKRVETRTWRTSLRCRILIHAALSWSPLQAELCQRAPFRRILRLIGADSHPELALPRGALLGTARVDAVIPTRRVRHVLPIADWQHEQPLGFFDPRHFAWMLSAPHLFLKPIPCGGKQRIFIVPDSVLRDAIAFSGDEDGDGNTIDPDDSHTAN